MSLDARANLPVVEACVRSGLESRVLTYQVHTRVHTLPGIDMLTRQNSAQ